ncbi:hypothetical protein D3C86_1573540 [compost metagenome]|jgi:hypothetical protein
MIGYGFYYVDMCQKLKLAVDVSDLSDRDVGSINEMAYSFIDKNAGAATVDIEFWGQAIASGEGEVRLMPKEVRHLEVRNAQTLFPEAQRDGG